MQKKGDRLYKIVNITRSSDNWENFQTYRNHSIKKQKNDYYWSKIEEERETFKNEIKEYSVARKFSH